METETVEMETIEPQVRDLLAAVIEEFGPFSPDARNGDKPFLKGPGEECPGWAICWESGIEWSILAPEKFGDRFPTLFLEPVNHWALGVYPGWSE